MGLEIDRSGEGASAKALAVAAKMRVFTARRLRRARFFFVFLYARGFFMADITESAESRQLLENLKGRMLVLKEHL